MQAVARYCRASSKLIHLKAALGIFVYAVRTSSLGISFRRGAVAGLSLLAWADANSLRAQPTGVRPRGESSDVRRDGQFYGTRRLGCKCVTLSTTQAEYGAMEDVGTRVLFLRQVWRFMLTCIPLYEDNEGAIQIAKHPISNSNLKHIDVRHYFLGELVERKELEVIRNDALSAH